jgi:hypothetical protein
VIFCVKRATRCSFTSAIVGRSIGSSGCRVRALDVPQHVAFARRDEQIASPLRPARTRASDAGARTTRCRTARRNSRRGRCARRRGRALPRPWPPGCRAWPPLSRATVRSRSFCCMSPLSAAAAKPARFEPLGEFDGRLLGAREDQHAVEDSASRMRVKRRACARRSRSSSAGGYSPPCSSCS